METPPESEKGDLPPKPKKDRRPPTGSGRFAAGVGLIYIIAGGAIGIFHGIGIPLPTAYVLPGWFVCSGLIALVWGNNRMNTGNPDDKTIGMDTINMLVTMLGVAAAIAALSEGAVRLNSH